MNDSLDDIILDLTFFFDDIFDKLNEWISMLNDRGLWNAGYNSHMAFP